MTEDDQDSLEKYEIDRAITKFKGTPLGDRAETALQAALAAIPFAGGSLASIYGSYSNEKKFERLFETLDALAVAVRQSEKKVEEILTREQTTELLDETLPPIMKASGEDKIRFLRTGLITSFTSDALDYETKHLFLSVLAGLSYVELKLLRAVYSGHDPYSFVDKASAFPAPAPASGIPSAARTLVVAGYRSFKEWRDDNLKPQLVDHLAQQVAQTPDRVRLISARLDASGLTRLAPALTHRQYRVFEETQPPQGTVTGLRYVQPAAVSSLQGVVTVVEQKHTQTPLEESQTELGRELVKFAHG